MRLEAGKFLVRLAENDADIDSALRLRYRVFVEELGAKSQSDAQGRERDSFDEHCEHLLLLDRSANAGAGEVVGAYRMLPGSAAVAGPGFYSAHEFDVTPFLERASSCLEVGRTCVAKDYRGGAAAQLLWAGIAAYVFEHDVGYLFGCASFPGTDARAVAQPLALLHHEHLAPPGIRARAFGPNRLEMDIMPADQLDRSEGMRRMPSLIKGYLRLGGFAGDGAWIDRDFGVIDVFLVVDVSRVDERRRAFYRDRIAGSLARVAD